MDLALASEMQGAGLSTNFDGECTAAGLDILLVLRRLLVGNLAWLDVPGRQHRSGLS